MPGRLRVIMDLEHAEPGAGLSNQLYGLVAILALGLETGCEIVLPPAHRRNGTYAVRCVCIGSCFGNPLALLELAKTEPS